MSEYQYYEFLAVDRPLDVKALAEVRSLSTRARITPTSFVNTYNWGDFKGNPQALVERYYDAFLYTANWGTRQLMLRLPTRLLDASTVWRYCSTDAANAWTSDDHLILNLTYTCDEGGEWNDEEWGWDDDDSEDSGRLASIIPVRADLAAGDHRLLYLAWLHAVCCEEIEPEDVEPPVPAGLATLSGSLQTVADFLHLDDDLITVAAQTSPPLSTSVPTTAELAPHLAALPPADKDALLLRVMDGDPHVGAELRRRLTPPAAEPAPDQKPRTVADLLTTARVVRAERERLAADRRAREQEAREKAAAQARARHLDALAAEGETVWRRVDTLIRATRPKEYDQAVALLVDLREIAARQGQEADVARRVRQIRTTYPKRPALLERLDRAGFTADSRS